MSFSKSATMASFVLVCVATAFAACGGDGSDGEGEQETAVRSGGGADGSGGAGGATSSSSGDAGGDASSGSGDGSGSSGSGSSGSGSMGAGSGGAQCNIMTGNSECGDCLADNCCFVINECMDEAFLSCVDCMDSFLSGDGETGCADVGKNHWIIECVAFNCETECAGS